MDSTLPHHIGWIVSPSYNRLYIRLPYRGKTNIPRGRSYRESNRDNYMHGMPLAE